LSQPEIERHLIAYLADQRKVLTDLQYQIYVRRCERLWLETYGEATTRKVLAKAGKDGGLRRN
jgi:hypothetical protein